MKKLPEEKQLFLCSKVPGRGMIEKVENALL